MSAFCLTSVGFSEQRNRIVKAKRRLFGLFAIGIPFGAVADAFVCGVGGILINQVEYHPGRATTRVAPTMIYAPIE